MPWLPRQRRTDAGGPRPGGSIRSSDPPRHPRPAQRHRGQRCAGPGGLAGVHGRAGPRCPNGLSAIARHPVLQTVHMRTFCRPSGRRSPSSPTSQMRRSRTSTTPRTLLLIPPTPRVSRSSRRCPLADSRACPPGGRRDGGADVGAGPAPVGPAPGQRPEVPPGESPRSGASHSLPENPIRENFRRRKCPADGKMSRWRGDTEREVATD
jgi:hypothetical protein